MTSFPVLDQATLQNLRELDEDGSQGFVAELLGLFITSSTERLQALGAALAAKDPRRLGAEAHSLKSSAGNIGALRLSQLCQSLENLGKSGDIQAAEALTQELRVELDRVLAAVRQLPEFAPSKAA